MCDRTFEKRMPWPCQRHNLPPCAGAWPMPANGYSAPSREEEKVSGSEDLQTALAKAETQPSTVSVTLIVKKEEWKQKSTHVVREEEASPKSRKENQKRQPVLQRSSHRNRRGKRQKS